MRSWPEGGSASLVHQLGNPAGHAAPLPWHWSTLPRQLGQLSLSVLGSGRVSPLALSHHNPLPASDRVSCPVQVQALGNGGGCWVSPSAVTLGLMEVLPDNCVQVGKKELMYAGTVGLIIYLGGVIFINRKSTSSAKMVMAEVAKTMATDNVSVAGVAWGMWQPCCCLLRQGLSAARGSLEQGLISPHAGEGVGVPRGHEELHRGFAAVQEGSVSRRRPGAGNSALLLRGGDPGRFCRLVVHSRGQVALKEAVLLH